MCKLAAFVADPRTAFLQDLVFESQIQEGADVRDALVVHDVELRLGVRCSHLVLHHFEAGTVTGDCTIACLDGTDAANVDPHARIEFQRTSPGGRFWIPKHHPNFLPDLIGEDAAGSRLGNHSGQFTEGSAHEPRLGAHGGVPDFPFQFLASDERCDRVNHHHVQGVGPHQRLTDPQGFFSRTRL